MKDESWGEDIGFACCDCRFYVCEDEAKNVGQCRRFPPREWFADVEEALWTNVAGYQWCGEFELSPTKRRAWEEEVRRRVGGRE